MLYRRTALARGRKKNKARTAPGLRQACLARLQTRLLIVKAGLNSGLDRTESRETGQRELLVDFMTWNLLKNGFETGPSGKSPGLCHGCPDMSTHRAALARAPKNVQIWPGDAPDDECLGLAICGAQADRFGRSSSALGSSVSFGFASTVTSTGAPCFRRTGSPFWSVRALSIRISR